MRDRPELQHTRNKVHRSAQPVLTSTRSIILCFSALVERERWPGKRLSSSSTAILACPGAPAAWRHRCSRNEHTHTHTLKHACRRQKQPQTADGPQNKKVEKTIFITQLNQKQRSKRARTRVGARGKAPEEKHSRRGRRRTVWLRGGAGRVPGRMKPRTPSTPFGPWQAGKEERVRVALFSLSLAAAHRRCKNEVRWRMAEAAT